MYIPKNRIITDLFTRGEEYKIASTGVPYSGSYWEMYNGTIFTGKNPNDKPSEQLIVMEFPSAEIYLLMTRERASGCSNISFNIKCLNPSLLLRV